MSKALRPTQGLHRRIILGAALIAAFTSPAIQAASYPERVVRIVVPTTAGGPADMVARTLATKLSESFGTQVIVENKPGANGIIGTDFVAKSAPDGHTLLLATGAFSINQAIYKKLPYNAVRDFAPVALVMAPGPFVLVSHSSVPAKTVGELIAYAKSQPQPLTYASAGIGNSTHLAGEMFEQLAGIRLQHVPYKGMSAGLNDVVAGQVQLMFNAWPSVESFVKQGKLQALAQTSAKRQAMLADLPTMQEAGVKGYEVTGWYALFAPTGTPADVVNKLNVAVGKAMVQADVKAKLATLGAGEPPPAMTADQVAAFVRNDSTLMAKVAKAAHLSLDPE